MSARTLITSIRRSANQSSRAQRRRTKRCSSIPQIPTFPAHRCWTTCCICHYQSVFRFSSSTTSVSVFLYTIFFLQLVSGPITRAENFIPQIKKIWADVPLSEAMKWIVPAGKLEPQGIAPPTCSLGRIRRVSRAACDGWRSEKEPHPRSPFINDYSASKTVCGATILKICPFLRRRL
jgi:hypothetical protein